jgi:myo-inositol-1(or 4)-monophosphatase
MVNLNENNNADLLELAKSTAVAAGEMLSKGEYINKEFSFDKENIKEIKAEADIVVENVIINSLQPTGVPILSEERGFLAGDASESRRWIIDPIDGTFNYIKGLGPCAISIALWEGERPIFGVVFAIDTGNLYWGGRSIGAFCNNSAISVSSIKDATLASVCTGFPVRLDMNSKKTAGKFWECISQFSKVRMIGCASMSLVNVAQGVSEVYFENQIMIWDVAAGLAITEGAGGTIIFAQCEHQHSLSVVASNNQVMGNRIS